MATEQQTQRNYIALAEQLAPIIKQNSSRINSERQIPSDIAEDLADQGFFRLLLPKSLGGAELEHSKFLDILEIIAESDTSTAWCLNQNNVWSTSATRMPEATATEIWKDQRAVVTNGPPSSTCKATPTKDGHILNGRWNFSSGCTHATWIAALSPIANADGSGLVSTDRKDMKIFLLPKGQVEFVDTWDAQGMRGTSSFGFELTDMFVPLNHTYDQDDAEPWHNGPHYIIPRTLLFAAGFSTVALATAKASLNIAVDFASAGQSGRKQTLMREQSTVQRSIGEARAIYSASRAYLRESMSTVWDSACSRGSLTLEERINLRLATTYAIRTAASVVDVCYNLCGSGAIFASNPIQRRFQDIHVITQHLQAHPTNYESAGQFFLGYEPEGNF